MRHLLAAMLVAVFLVPVVSVAAEDYYLRGHEALHRGDHERALYLISFLAANDDPRAQYDMGLFHRDGIAVEQDDVAALGWFLKAAGNGHMLAQYAAGLAFQRGRGSAADPVTALDYLAQAAMQGHAAAPLQIGQIHYAGEGVPRDLPRAYFWWHLAEARGAPGAGANLALLDKAMGADDKAAAAALVARCRTRTLRQCLPSNPDRR